MAGWQSGYAADCNSVYAGSIPTPASISFARMVKLVDTGDLKSPAHCERAGSIPAPGTSRHQAIIHLCGISSVGRAEPCQGSGRRFEPDIPLQIPTKEPAKAGFFVSEICCQVVLAVVVQEVSADCVFLYSR